MARTQIGRRPVAPRQNNGLLALVGVLAVAVLVLATLVFVNMTRSGEPASGTVTNTGTQDQSGQALAGPATQDYKFGVYSAPSGQSLADIDDPAQFATTYAWLVVANWADQRGTSVPIRENYPASAARLLSPDYAEEVSGSSLGRRWPSAFLEAAMRSVKIVAIEVVPSSVSPSDNLWLDVSIQGVAVQPTFTFGPGTNVASSYVMELKEEDGRWVVQGVTLVRGIGPQ